ncbi:MAG: PEGA domain-containing protein [Candidatus Uhrbacteria bacterium]|nr:PEGA domain-containing protein [Candidatus Uhrbacteria bacterium]
MTPTIRKILFYTFLALFFIGAPLIVLYTAGYRYSFNGGYIVRTGVLSVSTTPRNVNIFLNDIDTKRKSPYILKHQIPGNYTLKLQKDRYRTWEGKVEILSGQTTTIHNVLLFADAVTENLLEVEPYAFSANPDGTSVAYLNFDHSWYELWLYDLEKEKSSMIGRFSNLEDPELVWSAKGGYLLLHDSTQAEIFSKNGTAINSQLAVSAITTSIFWHPSTDNLLYMSTTEELLQLDLSAGSITTFNNVDAETILIDASIITFFDNGTNVELRQTVQDETSLIALLPRAEYKIAMRDAEFMLLTDEKSHIILINIHAEQPILLEKEVKLYDWLEDKDLLAFSDGNEIDVYDASSHNTEVVTRQGAAISAIKWHPIGTNILYTAENKLEVIEYQKIAEQRVTTTLIDNMEIESFWIDEDADFVFLYGTLDSITGLFELALTR